MPPLPDAPPPAPSSPSPLRGGDRGGGNHNGPGVPPSLSLPHKGGGDAAPSGRKSRSDGPVWKDGAFRRDTWARVADAELLPDTPTIVTRKRWLAEADSLSAHNAPLGLLLLAGEPIDDIAADLARFALIALDFPKFSDGRAFSTARLLREKHGFTGELRAVGNVLSDQIPFMRRVGFDAFEVVHGPTRRALAEGRIPEVALHYQPAVGDGASAGARPWLRQSRG